MYKSRKSAAKNKSRAAANSVSQRKPAGRRSSGFVDNRSGTAAQRKLRDRMNNSPKVQKSARLQAMATSNSIAINYAKSNPEKDIIQRVTDVYDQKSFEDPVEYLSKKYGKVGIEAASLGLAQHGAQIADGRPTGAGETNASIDHGGEVDRGHGPSREAGKDVHHAIASQHAHSP